ncbi:hypothetical protein [Sandarakinorhabdus limnophila]
MATRAAAIWACRAMTAASGSGIFMRLS